MLDIKFISYLPVDIIGYKVYQTQVISMSTLIKFIVSITLTQAIVASPVIAFQNISPIDAYNMTVMGDNTYILDVRTDAEWKWVGHPGKNKLEEGVELIDKVIHIPYWLEIDSPYQEPIWPIENHRFIIDINKLFGDNFNVVLITMCRSGGRSEMAATDLEQAGYTNVYNMFTGFEGGTDSRGYRTVSGWKNDGLPWSY